jgi:hypothetical protein
MSTEMDKALSCASMLQVRVIPFHQLAREFVAREIVRRGEILEELYGSPGEGVQNTKCGLFCAEYAVFAEAIRNPATEVELAAHFKGVQVIVD